jgi:hypothetical protein
MTDKLDPRSLFADTVEAHRTLREVYQGSPLDSFEHRVRATAQGLKLRYNLDELALLAAAGIDLFSTPLETP